MTELLFRRYLVLLWHFKNKVLILQSLKVVKGFLIKNN